MLPNVWLFFCGKQVTRETNHKPRTGNVMLKLAEREKTMAWPLWLFGLDIKCAAEKETKSVARENKELLTVRQDFELL